MNPTKINYNNKIDKMKEVFRLEANRKSIKITVTTIFIFHK